MRKLVERVSSLSRIILLLVTASVLAPACKGSSSSTTIDVTIDTDADLSLETVRLTTNAAGKSSLNKDFPAAGTIQVTIAPSGLDEGSTITLEAGGVKSGATVVLDRAQAIVRVGKRVSVRLHLKLDCLNVLSCKETETCQAGVCVPIPPPADATDGGDMSDVADGTGGASSGTGGTAGGAGSGGKIGSGGAASGGRAAGGSGTGTGGNAGGSGAVTGSGGAATGGNTGGGGAVTSTGGTSTGGVGTGGMGTGGSASGGAAGCTDTTSPNTCGASCTMCTAPTGGTPTCVSGACDFNCPSMKKCPGAGCVPTGGCCSNTDCPAMGGQTGTCDSGTHMCNYSCTGATQSCTVGGTTTCIPMGGCCTNTDCTGMCKTCNASHACVAAVNVDDPNARCPGTCDAAGACKSKKGQTCASTTGCITGSTCTNNYCCAASCGTDAKCGGTCAGNSAGTCTYPSATTACDDGLWCNGTDTCNGSGTCAHQFTTGNRCTGTGACDLTTCSESNQTCFKAAGTQCATPRVAMTCANTTSCAGQPQSQTFTRSCSGTASACPAEVAGTLMNLNKCTSTQLCSGSGSCTADISCQPSSVAWCDPTTGLCWASNPSPIQLSWADANSYCQTLNQGGRTGWRLPSVADFAAVFRGCSNGNSSVASGRSICRLTDPTTIAGCQECTMYGGPDSARGGCYWAPNTVPDACNMQGPWTSQELNDGHGTAWQAVPERGSIVATPDDDFAIGTAICVLTK